MPAAVRRERHSGTFLSDSDGAFENEVRRGSQRHRLIVMHGDVAAAGLYGNVAAARDKAVQRRRHYRRAGARTRSRRFAVTPLPDAHFEGRRVDYPHKFDIRPLAEERGILKQRTLFQNIDVVDSVDKDDKVRIAERKRGDFVGFAAQLHLSSDDGIAFEA